MSEMSSMKDYNFIESNNKLYHKVRNIGGIFPFISERLV